MDREDITVYTSLIMMFLFIGLMWVALIIGNNIMWAAMIVGMIASVISLLIFTSR